MSAQYLIEVFTKIFRVFQSNRHPKDTLSRHFSIRFQLTAFDLVTRPHQFIRSDPVQQTSVMPEVCCTGSELGLSNDWAYQIIKQVGNYSDIFERNIGPNTPLGIERGLNALWTDGGLQYSPPFR